MLQSGAVALDLLVKFLKDLDALLLQDLFGLRFLLKAKRCALFATLSRQHMSSA